MVKWKYFNHNFKYIFKIFKYWILFILFYFNSIFIYNNRCCNCCITQNDVCSKHSTYCRSRHGNVALFTVMLIITTRICIMTILFCLARLRLVYVLCWWLALVELLLVCFLACSQHLSPSTQNFLKVYAI